MWIIPESDKTTLGTDSTYVALVASERFLPSDNHPLTMPPKRLRSKKSTTSPNPQSSKHGRVNPGEPMATSPGKSPPSTPERESFQSTRSQASPTLSDTNMSPTTTSPAIDLTRPALTQPLVDNDLDHPPAKRLSFDTLLDHIKM